MDSWIHRQVDTPLAHAVNSQTRLGNRRKLTNEEYATDELFFDTIKPCQISLDLGASKLQLLEPLSVLLDPA